jgi:bifunctional non-homologous end joining protein LigD
MVSTYKKPENPEFMVLDIDPDKHDFKDVVTIALKFKEVFDELNIKCYAKTSGSSGIHVYVYIAAKYDYDFVKSFAEFVAQKVQERTSDITSVERSLNKRKGLIYLDFLQNRRGQTIAAPYSVRPKLGATVSFPLNWDELTPDLDMKDFHLKNVPELIKKRRNPWADIFTEKQDLKKALASLKSTKPIK